MVPNNDAPQRSRRAVKRSWRLEGYVTVADDAGKRQRPASAGSGHAQDSAAPPSHAGAQLDPEPAHEHSDDEEMAGDQQHDSGDEEMADSEEQEEGLEGDLRVDELDELVEKVNSKRRKGTRNKYSTNQKVWMRWCVNGGFLPNSKSICVDLTTEVAARGPLTRFMKWYVAGRAGDTVKTGRKATSATSELLRDADVNMHSALQQLVNDACRRAGKAPWTLRDAQGYELVFKAHCTRKQGDKAAGTGAHLHVSFTRDDYLRACELLLASGDPLDARTLSLTTYQASTVSRGDDVRPRHLAELSWRFLSSVGPSQCFAITVMQPPEGGKTLGTRPAYKGIIRAQLPSMWPLGALFRWLATRFGILGHPLPMPGTLEWQSYLLWPGRARKEMTPSNHAELMKKLYKQLGVAPTKVTHELRVFAAQAMYEMGVSLEVIQRIGHWLLDSFGTSYIVPGFTPEALLALGFWPGAAQKDFSGYWAERFHVAVPRELVYALMPGLQQLEAEAVAAQQAAVAGPRSGRVDPEAAAVARVLRMGAVMVVQDALELAERFPDNPIHKLLVGYQCFRDLLFRYKNGKRLGTFASQRPLSVKEQIEHSIRHLHENCLAAITSAAQLNWQGFEKLLRELTQGTATAPAGTTAAGAGAAAAAAAATAAEGAGTLPEDVVNNLEAMAAGQLPPSPEQQQRIEQQLQQLELDQQEAEQQDGLQDDCFASGASNAAAAADLTQQLCTPSGAVHLLPEVAGRAADTMTPGGGHYTAFMTGREEQLPFVQQQQQQSKERPPGLSDGEWQMVLQLRQQQQQQQQQQQRPPGLTDSEWQILQQARLKQAQQRQQQPQQQQGYQLGSTVLQQMGTVEPLGEIALPHITAQGAAAAGLGAAGAHSSRMRCADGSVPAAAVVECLQDMSQHIILAITRGLQQQGCSCARRQHQQQQQQQCCEDQDMDEEDGAGQVLQQKQQKQKQQQQSKNKGIKPFPSLSVHTSLEALARWYAVQPHHSAVAAGRTIKQMEDDNSHAWRAGGAKQRWSEYAVLLYAIEERQEQMVDAQRRLGRRGVQVDIVAAAQKLDEERLALPNPNPKSTKPMSVCQFREHLSAQGKAAAIARLAAEAAEAGAAGAEQQ